LDHYDYLKWFLFFAWFPTVIIWLFYWRILIKYKKVFLLCMIGAVLFGYPWDYFATHVWLWRFSPDHTLGMNFLGLPVEEYIFFASEALLYSSLALVLRQKIWKENQ
jgi:lycopene cyclase domain-containing protein